jgi:hypothetical protein
MAVVVDDHLLLDLLADDAPRALAEAARGEEVFTTGSWYYRLGRAATAGTGEGAISSRVTARPERERAQVLDSLLSLPHQIGLLGFRSVAPVMLTLRARRALNLLNAEALAVAVLVDGRILTKTHSPLLVAGAADIGVRCHLLP